MMAYLVADAYITITEHRNPLGRVERYDYHWEGGSIAAISDALLLKLIKTEDYIWFDPGTVFVLGPFRLRVLDNNPIQGITFVSRDGWQTTLRYYFYRATRLFDLIYRRLIVTAAVWGLAEYDRAVIPSWRDLRLIRRLTARSKRGSVS